MADVFGDGVFEGDGFPMLDPSPDEDAWEAFLEFAWERIEGRDENGIDNPLVAKIESAVGTMLPFEVGLLLVMGVPDGNEWFRWSADPAADLAAFNARLRDGFDDDATRVEFDAAPQLLPLHSRFAVPVTVARDETSSDANPVLAVSGSSVTVAGRDLADWLHRHFDVPLPMWPETAERWFPFWSDLVDQ